MMGQQDVFSQYNKMKNNRRTIITLIGIVFVLALAIPAGLLATFLFAQEAPPQVGHGALHKVEITTVDKCEATIIAFTASNRPETVTILAEDEICQDLTGEFIAVQATQILQETLDKCQPLSSLPNEDPDKRVDPSTKNPKAKSLKWRVRPDNTYICSSPVTVTITWERSEYNLSWRSTNAG